MQTWQNQAQDTVADTHATWTSPCRRLAARPDALTTLLEVENLMQPGLGDLCLEFVAFCSQICHGGPSNHLTQLQKA